ncbi:MAG: radical SAM protein [Candidatus Promineifilaceae bacterium]
MVRLPMIDLGRRLLNGLQRDLTGFLGVVGGPAPPRPGLYCYEVEASGGRRRLHLRVGADGNGVLFVDVNDVIHLNQTAAQMAKCALDLVPLSEARRLFGSQVAPADRRRLSNELEQIYDMVERFMEPSIGCPTCAVTSLERAPLFSQRADAPYKADLALTYGCNNECAHCYNEPDRFVMPSLKRSAWLDVLDCLYQIGVPHVIFTGGEATLHPNLPELIQYADSLGMVTGLNTNGRRMAQIPYTESLARAGLDHVQITLGSSRPDIHNAMMGATSFRQTVQGIRNALASNIHTITNTTLMRCNAGHVEQIIDFLYELGIRSFAMNGMIYSAGGFANPDAIPEEEMPPLLIRVRDHAAERGMRFLWYTPTEYCRMSPVELEIGAKRCNAGEYSICIEPNGDVLPCQSYYVAAGNILVDRWQDIWRGQLFRSFRDRELNPSWAGLPEKCWACPDLPLCGGGCRIEREAREGRRVAQGAGGCCGCNPNGGQALVAPAAGSDTGYVPAPGAANGRLRATGQATAIVATDSIMLGEARPASDALLPAALPSHSTKDCMGHKGRKEKS